MDVIIHPLQIGYEGVSIAVEVRARVCKLQPMIHEVYIMTILCYKFIAGLFIYERSLDIVAAILRMTFQVHSWFMIQTTSQVHVLDREHY